jgi:ribA/ribD-fused uncharacterized protein
MQDDTEESEKVVLFYREGSWGSQWTYSPFVYHGTEYTCAEQYMMSKKAKLFHDKRTRRKIMKEHSPMEMKRLGREVEGFSYSKWRRKCLKIVVKANYCKFSQNEEFKEALLATGDKIIGEASPYDMLWGIGCGMEEPEAWRPKKWQGENLLGIALMKVRKKLRREEM